MIDTIDPETQNQIKFEYIKPGLNVCINGHDNPLIARFCKDCGVNLSEDLKPDEVKTIDNTEIFNLKRENTALKAEIESLRVEVREFRRSFNC